MKLKLYFSNEQQKIKISFRMRRLITKAVKEALKQENFEYFTEISVSFIDNEAIHKLNLQYREKDKHTDVLSFPIWEKDELEDGSAFDGHAVTLGDIIISAEQAEAQAKEYGHSFEREIGFLTVYSMLHLFGFDHMTKEDEEEMFSYQAEILDRMGLKR